MVYIGDGGCLGADNFFNNRPIPAKPAPIYYPGQVKGTCELPAGRVADIATSDVYGEGCGTLPGGQLPSNMGDFLGPIQPMVFVVPKASSQKSISQDAAYFVFGFGDDSGVEPWTVSSSLYRRNTTSAVQAFLAIAIGVPIDRWAGVDAPTLPANVSASLSGAAAVINALELDPNPEQALGILANTNYERHDRGSPQHLGLQRPRPNLRLLPGLEPDRARQSQRSRRTLRAVGRDPFLHVRR